MRLTTLPLICICLAFSQSAIAHESVMPVPGEPKSFAAPRIEVTPLKEGVQLIYVQNKTTPLTRMTMVAWNGVGNEEGDNEAGLSSVGADLLLRATETQTTDAVLQTFQRLAADVQTSTRMDHTALSVDVLSETLAPTLQLLDSLFVNPKLDEADLERVRRKHLQALIQEADEPRSLAIRKFFDVTYAGHPMQRWRTGTEAGLKALKAERLKSWQNATWTKTAVDIVVVSSLPLEEVRNALTTNLTQLLGAHSSGARPLIAELPSPTEPAAPKLVWVDKPGASQSVLMLGKAAVGSEAERASRSLGNDVLGGQFSARINLNLREDKGYTYGAYSRILDYQHGSTFYSSSSVRGDVTAASLNEMLKEIREIQKARPVTEREFGEVQTSAVLKWPSQFSPGPRLVYALVGLLREGRDPRSLADEVSGLQAVSIESAQKSLNILLANPHPWVLVIVGDAAKWKESVDALNWSSLL